MKSLTKSAFMPLTMAMLTSLLVACGQTATPGDKAVQTKPVGHDQPSGSGNARVRGAAEVGPIETLLVGDITIPNLLSTQDLPDQKLVVEFRSNIEGATFQCRVDLDVAFKACDTSGAARYDFGRLVNGRGYLVAVRARSPEGLLDESPLVIEFTVDNLAGESLASQTSTGGDATEARPINESDIPENFDPSAMGRPDDANPVASRALLVGGFYGAVVPNNMVVTSYATTKTYNAALRVIRLLDSGYSDMADQSCSASYERVLPGPLRYCDATPTRLQMATMFPSPMPYNHVEYGRGLTATSIDERLLVAAYGDEPDPAESQLNLGAFCSNSGDPSLASQGRVAVPLLNRFFNLTPSFESFSWCQTRDNEGVYWWVGSFEATLSQQSNNAASSRLRVIYALSTKMGIRSGAQFAAHASNILPKLIIPLAPAGVVEKHPSAALLSRLGSSFTRSKLQSSPPSRLASGHF